MYVSDVKHSSPSLEEKLAHIYTLGKKTITMDFRQQYIELLEAFGSPHKSLPPVIHVAGTNGKGSIIATLRAIFEESGLKVHAYTSPHLCAFNERILLAGKYIDDGTLESLIDEALEHNAGKDITFFELTTAMSFAAFSRVPADVLLLEVGMGGRLDCTNIVEKPIVSIIGSIGYDHMEFLGSSLEKIAAEKGGIIKPGVPCVIAAQKRESAAAGVVKILTDIANQRGASVSRAGAEWFTHDQGDVFRFVHKDVEMILPRPNLQGTHQVANAGTALAALQIIKDHFGISQGAIARALKKIYWPARLQNLTAAFALPGGWEIWLDGGHNTDAANALAAQAVQWEQDDGRPLHLVLGMMNRKDPVKFAGILQKHLASITAVAIQGEPQGFKPAEMEKQLQKAFSALRVTSAPSVAAAAKAITLHKEPGRILVAGSLYLAGDVLKSCGERR